MKTSLVIRNLKVFIRNWTLEVPSLELGAGKITCIMGKSGSGKSTLLNVIAGFTEIQTGEILLNGSNLSLLPPEKRKTAFIFQTGALFQNLTVIQNVIFPLKLQKIPKDIREAKAREWLKQVEISHLENRSVSALSGGEAQRVQIARAFITGFPVLLLDEPFSALDTDLRKQLRGVLKKLVKENEVVAVLVTHDPQDAEDLSDSLYRMEEGRLTSIK